MSSSFQVKECASSRKKYVGQSWFLKDINVVTFHEKIASRVRAINFNPIQEKDTNIINTTK